MDAEMDTETTRDQTMPPTRNILDEYEHDEAQLRLPPSGTWNGTLHSWEKRTVMPEWHALKDCTVYNLRFTVTADRDFAVFAEATTTPIRRSDGRLRMECILAAQVLKLAGITKEAFATALDKDEVLEQAMDQCKVTPLRIRGTRSRVDEGDMLNGKPRRKPRFWINELTRG